MTKNLSLRNSKNAKKGLIELCKYMKSNAIIPIEIGLEVGSFSGDSARIFSSFFKKIYCVDQWESNYDPTKIDLASDPNLYDMQEVEDFFDRLVKEQENIIKIKKSSNDAVKEFENNMFNFVYIDANHNFLDVKNDITLWLPKVKKGGFICGHDYQSKFPGVIKAVNELLGKPDKVFPDTSWVKKVK